MKALGLFASAATLIAADPESLGLLTEAQKD